MLDGFEGKVHPKWVLGIIYGFVRQNSILLTRWACMYVCACVGICVFVCVVCVCVGMYVCVCVCVCVCVGVYVFGMDG